MTSIAKFASVLVIAIAPVINAQGPVSADHAFTNPALSDNTVLVATADSLPITDTNVITNVLTTSVTSNKNETKKSVDVAGQVKAYFASTPILAEIAFCESTLRQFDSEGNVLRGKVDSADVGVMQINERYHKKTAEKLGLNLHTLEGNMAYAEYLYSKKGAQPWNASKPCWGNR